MDDAIDMTEAFVFNLLQLPDGKVRNIDLVCHDNISVDVIPWAKERGVEVIVKSYDPNTFVSEAEIEAD